MFLKDSSPRSARRIAGSPPHQRGDLGRDDQAARLGRGLHPGGEVHAGAEDVALGEDRLGDMQAHAEEQRRRGIPFGHGGQFRLHPQRGADRLGRRREGRNETVPGIFDQLPFQGGDRRLDDLLQQRGQALVGRHLLQFHQAGVARDIRGQDGDETTVLRRDHVASMAGFRVNREYSICASIGVPARMQTLPSCFREYNRPARLSLASRWRDGDKHAVKRPRQDTR